MTNDDPSSEADDAPPEAPGPDKSERNAGDGEARVKRGRRLNRELLRAMPRPTRRAWSLDSMAKLEGDMRSVLELDPDTFLGPLEALVRSEDR